jgi:hypothetical protein
MALLLLAATSLVFAQSKIIGGHFNTQRQTNRKPCTNSSADLLKNILGVYVNASKGEVGNSVYTRGLNYKCKIRTFQRHLKFTNHSTTRQTKPNSADLSRCRSLC